MKKHLRKVIIIFVLVCLVIGGFFYVNNVENPFSYFNTLTPPAMTADLVGSYNHVDDDFIISITFASEGENFFQYIDSFNHIEDIGSFEKVGEGVYSLEGSMIEKQEIKVMDDFSFELKVDGKSMVFQKESQTCTWIGSEKLKQMRGY